MTTTPVNASRQRPSEEPEDRRSHWLLAFLILPVFVAPAVVAVAALAVGRHPFPWDLIGTVFAGAAMVGTLAGLAVMTVPRLAKLFGAPLFFIQFDEREKKVRYSSYRLAFLVTMVVLFVAQTGFSSEAALYASTAGLTTWYLSMIFFNRRY